MRVAQVLAASALLVIGAFPMPLVAQPQQAAQTPDTYSQIDRIFAEYQREKHIPGLIYGIVADGRLVHTKSFGVQELVAKRPVTPDSLFRIASMTKAFTALAILRLRDEGKLSLDAAAELYVPQLKGWRYPTADAPRIRVRDLLNHTAGFVNDDPWADRQTPLPEEQFTAMLAAGVPFTRVPGTAMEYSNFGYAVLGRIIANVSGQPYRTYVERTLLQPLKMQASGFEVTEAPKARRAIGYRWENEAWAEEPTLKHGAFGAIGSLQVSANDYARYVAWLLSAWPPRDEADTGPVRRATVRELAQGSNFAEVQQRPLEEGTCHQAFAYGMGMRVINDCEFGLVLTHGGGYPGYGSGLLLLPEYGVGLFVFGNRTYGGGSDALWQAASLLNKSGALKDRPRPMSAALASAYQTARAIYRKGDVSVAQGQLADNFLMDRSAANWRRELQRLKREVGECENEAPPYVRGELSTNFRWFCERGMIDGFLLLAPTHPVTIQQLRLTVTPPPK